MKRKISQPSTSRKKCKTPDSDKANIPDPILGTIFEGCTFHIHPANFGVGRLKIFEKQVERYGGQVIKLLPCSSENLSHIIFDESLDPERVNKLLDPSKFPNAVYVKCSWLSQCIKTKSRELTADHEIKVTTNLPGKGKSKVELNTISNLGNCGDTKATGDQNTLCFSNDNTTGTSSCMEDTNSKHDKDIDFIHTPGTSTPFASLHKHIETKTDPCSKVDTAVLMSNFANLDEDDQHTSGTQKEKIAISMEDRDNEQSKSIVKAENTIKSEDAVSSVKHFPKNLQKKFVCSQPSSSQPKGFNSHITTELEKLASAYKSKNDTWRALGYQKAISAIRNHPKEITSREEALSIRGVGARLADKVAEIVESGKLRKVAEVCDGEEAKALQLFMGVWGAGPNTAQSWYIQGFRSLNDLHTKATLTRHQQIGLKYYDDINSRIPRDEVAEIEDYVREAVLSVQKGLLVTVCGSYRRGKPTCGDVDILISHPDGHSHENLFKPILKQLRDTGFLTDDLVTQDDNGSQKKYLGVCILPGKDRKHRRLDVIVVPYAELAPALMYFTGSAHFNRSMRLLAIKMGMSLSEHGLRTGIVRQGGQKLTVGRLLDTPTEESIFAHLGLEYRSPQERDH